jgi:hypothetical protein
MFNGKKINPTRGKLFRTIADAMKLYSSLLLSNPVEARIQFNRAIDANQEFLDRSRGKGKAKPFIKSVANARRNSTYFPPSKRNGAKECARRIG